MRLVQRGVTVSLCVWILWKVFADYLSAIPCVEIAVLRSYPRKLGEFRRADGTWVKTSKKDTGWVRLQLRLNTYGPEVCMDKPLHLLAHGVDCCGVLKREL